MNCSRCDGLMLQEVFKDFADTDGSFEGWHCLVCGEIVDPVIASNRVLLMSGALGQAVHGAGWPMSRTTQRPSTNQAFPLINSEACGWAVEQPCG